VRVGTVDDAVILEAIDQPEPDGWTAAAYASTLSSPASHAIVADDEGFAVVLIAADEAELLRIVVGEARRRRGTGRALLHACHALFVDHDVARAFLDVRVDNVAARSLYARAGWMEVGWRRRYYSDGADAIVMRWSPGAEAVNERRGISTSS